MNAFSLSTRKILRSATLVAATGILVAGVPATAAPTGSAPRGSNEDAAVRFVEGAFNRGDLATIDRLVRFDYVEHDPARATGRAALRTWVAGLKAAHPRSRTTIKRLIAEKDLVAVHSHLVLTPGTRGRAVFDVYRFDRGRIAEHWGVSQEVPENSVNGNDMFGTVTRPQLPGPDPRASASTTRRVVTAQFAAATVARDVTAFDRNVAPGYVQHNPGVANGLTALKDFFRELYTINPALSGTVARIVVQGDYAVVHSHFQLDPQGPGVNVMDVFRVRGGKIVEHWDVLQPVSTNPANDNGEF
ncbi:nuclear transport factor 2 family protein [Lentzea sp. NPDC058450]|uniref:nuclear transport factor 2 family protein n=1 Tax=Lentzea sp. NPDC058450 TaxID=3346505 RepID=UPI00365A50D9